MPRKNESESEPQQGTEKKNPSLVAHNHAVSQLIEQHRPEYNEYRAAKSKELGIEWSPEPTEQERRDQQMRALVAQDPDILRRLGLVED